MPGEVLVVEDEAAIRSMLVAFLADAGYRTRQAADGLEAIRAVAAHRPHVILLDLALPVLDGWAFLRWLRTQPGGARMPVLVLSGTHRPAWDAANINGVLAYLPKPFHPDDVLREVVFLLAYAQARGHGADEVPTDA